MPVSVGHREQLLQTLAARTDRSHSTSANDLKNSPSQTTALLKHVTV